MPFKLKDKTISTSINLGLARKLAEAKIVDMLDPDGAVSLNEIFASPLKKLDFLYEVVKDQVGDKDEYESNLDINEAFSSLEDDVANFFQAVGSSERWLGIRNHSRKVSERQMKLMEAVLDDPKVNQMMDTLKDEALAQLGTELNASLAKSE
jgi:hypothetical protein